MKEDVHKQHTKHVNLSKTRGVLSVITEQWQHSVEGVHLETRGYLNQCLKSPELISGQWQKNKKK